VGSLHQSLVISLLYSFVVSIPIERAHFCLAGGSTNGW